MVEELASILLDVRHSKLLHGSFIDCKSRFFIKVNTILQVLCHYSTVVQEVIIPRRILARFKN